MCLSECVYDLGIAMSKPSSLIPQPGNVAAWDRYAYVRNNPLRYTDPSGHCTGDPNDPSDPDVECWEKLRTLNKMYDGIFSINSQWSFDELLILEQALAMLLKAYNNDLSLLEQAVAPLKSGPWSELLLNRTHDLQFIQPVHARYSPLFHSINFYDLLFTDNPEGCIECQKWDIIHDIGHGVDYAGSRDVYLFSEEAGYSRCLFVSFSTPAGYIDSYASSSLTEDFSQTFTYSIYLANGSYLYGNPPSAGRMSYFLKIIPALRITQD